MPHNYSIPARILDSFLVRILDSSPARIPRAIRFKDKHIDWLRRRKNADEPVPFVMLARNVYLHRRYRVLKPDDIQVCRCRKWPGKDGCSDDTCLLRQLYVECTPGFCPCQETCTNQKFQKCQYASTEVRRPVLHVCTKARHCIGRCCSFDVT
jgi:hypothetical protein